MALWKTLILCFEEECQFRSEGGYCTRDKITLGKPLVSPLGKLDCRQAEEKPQTEPEEEMEET